MFVILPDDWLDGKGNISIPYDGGINTSIIGVSDISPSDGVDELRDFEKLGLMRACVEHLSDHISKQVSIVMETQKTFIVNFDVAPRTIINNFLIQEGNQAGIALLSKDDIRKVLSDTAEELGKGICSILDISTKGEHNSWNIIRT